MKYLLVLGLLFSFAAQADYLEQKQQAFDRCAQRAAKDFFDSYKVKGEEGKNQFVKDLCTFHSVPLDACEQSIAMTLQQGKLQGAINMFIYEAGVVPKCGEFPEK